MNNYNYQCKACSHINQFDPSQWQTYKLNKVAKRFIKDNKIEPGYGLAKYLSQSSSLDNHASVGEWLSLLLSEGAYTLKDLQVELQKKVPVRFFKKVIR